IPSAARTRPAPPRPTPAPCRPPPPSGVCPAPGTRAAPAPRTTPESRKTSRSTRRKRSSPDTRPWPPPPAARACPRNQRAAPLGACPRNQRAAPLAHVRRVKRPRLGGSCPRNQRAAPLGACPRSPTAVPRRKPMSADSDGRGSYPPRGRGRNGARRSGGLAHGDGSRATSASIPWGGILASEGRVFDSADIARGVDVAPGGGHRKGAGIPGAGTSGLGQTSVVGCRTSRDFRWKSPGRMTRQAAMSEERLGFWARLAMFFWLPGKILFNGVAALRVRQALQAPAEEAPAALPAPAPKPPERPAGAEALQLLSILQRDGRLVDFLLED